jgi:RNA polymerase sigma factor (sigma-70 family)
VSAIGRGDAAAPATQDIWGGLMAAAQDGNGGAYRRLLGEVAEWLNRYFTRRLPMADVDDAIQETLLAIHRRRHSFDPAQPLGPWLGAIARRKWIDQLRLIERRPDQQLPDDIPIADHEDAVTAMSVLTSLLRELRPAQSLAIELVKLRGFTIEEASRETGQSPSAIKVNIHRGLARITAIIEKNDHVA